MAHRSSPPPGCRRRMAGVGILLLAATPAWAQSVSPLVFRPPVPAPCQPAPCPPYPPPGLPPYPSPGVEPGREGEPSRPPEPPTFPVTQPEATAPAFGSESGVAGSNPSTSIAASALKGHQLGIPALAFIPPRALAQAAPTQSILAPSVRSFSLSDNQSPGPQDRAYVNFNYFDNVGAAVNRRFGVDLRDISVYRETFGFEKTCLDGKASVGLQAPLNTLSAESGTAGLGGTDTAFGDVSVILKYAYWQNRETGSLLSAGLVVTAPTGPSHFADSSVPVLRDTLIQPYLGYRLARDRLFVHGFLSVEAPTDSRDVTLLFNDFGVGYVLYQGRGENGLITGIVPTLELHVTDPLNHRGVFRTNDPAGTADIVDLTMATTFGLGRHSLLAVGVVTPLTGPKPFDVEALVQFTWNFGARGAGDGGRHPGLAAGR